MRADEFLKSDLSVDKFKIMQVNLGNLCNLVCHHCHVEANPKGVNTMDKKNSGFSHKNF